MNWKSEKCVSFRNEKAEKNRLDWKMSPLFHMSAQLWCHSLGPRSVSKGNRSCSSFALPYVWTFLNFLHIFGNVTSKKNPLRVCERDYAWSTCSNMQTFPQGAKQSTLKNRGAKSRRNSLFLFQSQTWRRMFSSRPGEVLSGHWEHPIPRCSQGYHRRFRRQSASSMRKQHNRIHGVTSKSLLSNSPSSSRKKIAQKVAGILRGVKKRRGCHATAFFKRSLSSVVWVK